MAAKLKSSTRKSLVARGVPTDVIEKVAAKGDNVTTLTAAGKRRLVTKYGKTDGELLYAAVNRPPIADDVVEELLERARRGCCFCRDAVTRPYQIHHINLYSQSLDHSIDNLAVVCPTCHTTIHRDSTPPEVQREAREGWYAMVRLARTYEEDGISFPFDAFDPLVFGFEPRPADLLAGREPSASTCVDLAESELGRRCETLLANKNRAVVFGGPGSGKSTLAVGVAGKVGASSVFRYRTASASLDSRRAVEEILHFLRLAEQDSVLIVDDMNRWAAVADLEKVLQAATRCKVLVVWSDGAGSRENDAAPHTVDVRMRVSWAAMSPDVLDFIAEHEAELTPHVATLRGKGGWPQVGYGLMERPLLQLARRYAKEARNAWHLTYLLGGGAYRVREQLESLAGPDLAVAPIVQVAINQIAGFEQPTSAAEAAEACAVLFPGVPKDSLTEWIESLFKNLASRRLLLRARHGFVTVHREWARSFICAALGDPGCTEATAQLVRAELERGVQIPRRTSLLLSWLINNSAGERFLRSWASDRSSEEMESLLSAGVNDGVVTASILLAKLQDLAFGVRGLSSEVRKAIVANLPGLSALVESFEAEEWFLVKDLVFALERLDVQLLRKLLGSVTPENVGTKIETTPPEYLEAVVSFLNSAEKADPAFVAKVGGAVDWEKAVEFVRARLRPGDIESVEELAELGGRLGQQLLRSLLDRYGRCLQAALSGAVPSNLRVTPVITMPYMEYWPKCLEGAVGELDANAWAKDLETSDPQTWRRVLMVCGWTSRAGFSFAEDLANAVRLQELTANIGRKRPGATALKCLMSVLSRASDANRKVFAESLAPFVSDLLPRDAGLIRALGSLDLTQAEALATSVGTSFVEAETDLFFQPLRAGRPASVLEEADELEASGDDFDVSEFFAGRALDEETTVEEPEGGGGPGDGGT